MKQHITLEQWREISPQKSGELIEKMKLKFNPDTSFNPPNIGQMIEFLLEYGKRNNPENKGRYGVIDPDFIGIDFCDVLWEAIKDKEVLK